jgi:hypothetical protein
MRKREIMSTGEIAKTAAAKRDRNAPPHEKLQWLHTGAQRAGLECLATEWKGRLATYSLRCNKGHQFSRQGGNILDGAVCLECRDLERLQRLQDLAKDKGGQCLEPVYLGLVPHRFLCAHGHRWAAHPYNITNNGNWCPQCVNIERAERMRKQDGLAELQHVAAAKGGRCLSDAYIASNHLYRFECSEGHHWQATASQILLRSWCKYCAAKKIGMRHRAAGFQRLQQTLKEKGGVCLDDYAGSQERHRFRCHNGHEWSAIATNIIMGVWCGQCVKDEKRKQKTEILCRIAQEHGGALLSEYVNKETKIHCECHRGHRWYAWPSNTQKGHWCPICSHMDRAANPKNKTRWKYSPRGVTDKS